MLEYDSINKAVISMLPHGSCRILDLGCGCGSIGELIKHSNGFYCHVTGLTFNNGEAIAASSVLDEVIIADLNQFDFTNLHGLYDCVICSHVLEHLYNPDLILAKLHKVLLPHAVLIVALPNVLAWRQRLMFLFGMFRYTDGGLMDRTHYRFFDWVSARQLLIESGYDVKLAIADGVFPGAKWIPIFGPLLNRVALYLAPSLFAFQFVIKAVPKNQ